MARSKIAAEREYALMVEEMMGPAKQQSFAKPPRKKRPESAGPMRSTTKPAVTASEADATQKRRMLEQEIARLESRAEQQQQQQQQQQRLQQQQQQQPSRAALLEQHRQRQRWAEQVEAKQALQALVAELESKHDAAQVQLKRSATQLASLRSKLRSTESELEALRNSTQLRSDDMAMLRDENAHLKQENRQLQRSLEVAQLELRRERETRKWGCSSGAGGAHTSPAKPAASPTKAGPTSPAKRMAETVEIKSADLERSDPEASAKKEALTADSASTTPPRRSASPTRGGCVEMNFSKGRFVARISDPAVLAHQVVKNAITARAIRESDGRSEARLARGSTHATGV